MSSKDKQEYVLVKPSHPQLKDTVWEPDTAHYEEQTRNQPIQWVNAVSALETNAYRINEKVLEVAKAIDKDPIKRLPEGLPNYEEDKAQLDQRYKDNKIDELEILKRLKLLSKEEIDIRAEYWTDHYDLVNRYGIYV